MSKFREGRRVYDTDEAELIFKSETDLPYEDLFFTQVVLYRAPNGRFFTFCESGAGGPFARQEGPNHWTSGSEGHVLTAAQALEWLREEGAPKATIARYFPARRAQAPVPPGREQEHTAECCPQ